MKVGENEPLVGGGVFISEKVAKPRGKMGSCRYIRDLSLNCRIWGNLIVGFGGTFESRSSITPDVCHSK